jgi:hypothetical protein
MLSIGFSFQKGRFRVAALECAASTIQVNASRLVPIDPALPYPELMDRYVSHFQSVREEFKPGVIAARQSWKSTSLDDAIFQITPLGLLGYVAHVKSIRFRAYTSEALRKGAHFGLPKGANPLGAIDAQFGTHPPYWDDMQKYPVLAAWRALREMT